MARKKQLRIARYRTEKGAKRYAKDCATAWPMYHFETGQHPYDFGFTVILRTGANYAAKAYVLSRPKGGAAALGYTGH